VDLPDLVVLGGIARRTSQFGSLLGPRDLILEVDVQRVLAGVPPSQRVSVSVYSGHPLSDEPEGVTGIFELSSTARRRATDFELLEWQPVGETRAVEALWRAARTCEVFGSSRVVLGRWEPAEEEGRPLVMVNRTLLGEPPRAGESFCLNDGTRVLWRVPAQGEDLLPWDAEILLLDKDTGPSARRRCHYRTANCDELLKMRLPLDFLPEVLAGLGQRHAVATERGWHDAKADGKPCRGVPPDARVEVYRGSAEEALELLGSSDDHAEAMARVRLLRLGVKAVLPVERAICNQLFCDDDGATLRQPHPDRVLSLATGLIPTAPVEIVPALLDGILTRLERNPDAPPCVIPRPARLLSDHAQHLGRESRHILAGLARNLCRAEDRQEFGARFLSLRGVADAGWSEELQLASDAVCAEESVDSAHALRLGAAIERRPFGGDLQLLRFSRQSSFMRDASSPCHFGFAELSRDGGRAISLAKDIGGKMPGLCYMSVDLAKEVVEEWDVSLLNFDDVRGAGLTASDDLYFFTREGLLIIDRETKDLITRKLLCGEILRKVAFSPDGKVFAMWSTRPGYPESCPGEEHGSRPVERLRICDVSSGRTRLMVEEIENTVSSLDFLAEGCQLVVTFNQRQPEVWELPQN